MNCFIGVNAIQYGLLPLKRNIYKIDHRISFFAEMGKLFKRKKLLLQNFMIEKKALFG